MQIILYLSGDNTINQRLRQTVEASQNPGDIHVCRSILGLRERLLEMMHDGCLVVLLAATQTDLGELLRLSQLLFDFRIILVLPDQAQETLTLGHLIYPRFITYIDSDFQDLAAVLNKLDHRRSDQIDPKT